MLDVPPEAQAGINGLDVSVHPLSGQYFRDYSKIFVNKYNSRHGFLTHQRWLQVLHYNSWVSGSMSKVKLGLEFLVWLELGSGYLAPARSGLRWMDPKSSTVWMRPDLCVRLVSCSTSWEQDGQGAKSVPWWTEEFVTDLCVRLE